MKAPRLARLILWLAAAADRREDALGDLEEAHRARRRSGRATAWVRSHVEATMVGAVLLWQRLLSASIGGRLMTAADLRYAARGLARQPLMALTATIALAVGIGLTTVGFATMEAMLFSRLPFENGDRWIRVQPLTALEREPAELAPESYARLAAIEGLAHLGAATSRRESVSLDDGRREEIVTAAITPSTFAHMPATPLRGRLLSAADAEPGRPGVALLSERYSRRIGGAAATLDSALSIGASTYTVVGILPESFEFPSSPDVWLPLDDGFLTGLRPLARDARLFGIRAPGVGLQELTARLAVVAPQLTPAPGTGALSVDVTAYTDLGPRARDLSTVIVLVVTAVLLVIAANVGNLVLARSFARSREFALRAALGASRRRLVAQVATEVLLLGLAAAVLGAVAARAVLRQFDAMDELPFWIDFTGGPLTAMLVAAATLLATLVAGAWPALRATRRDLLAGLQASDGRSSDVRFGRAAGAMVVLQVAVSVVMLHGALVVAQGFRDYTNVDLDLPANIVTTGMSLDPARAGAGPPITARDVEEAAAAVPGVIAAGVTTALPRHSPRPRLIELDGIQAAPAMRAPSAEVSASYFPALDTDARAGRLFTAADALPGAPPVAVVNEPFVAKFLAGGPAVGRRLRLAGGAQPWMDIVGVVPDLGLSVADPTLAAGFYTPLRADARQIYLAARVRGEPMIYAEPLRKALRDRDPAVTPYRLQRLDHVASEDRAFFAGFSAALMGLGVVTLALALIGVYSMMSLIVSKRTHEIGIRMALGATANRIVRTIAGRAAAQVLAGGALGAGLALLSLNLRAQLVSRLGDGGAWTLPLVLALLMGAALLATWLPIRRALRVRPQDSLRAH